MTLAEGNIDKKYVVEQVNLPITLEKRMESLGMTIGSKVTLLQQKRNKTSVILIRGTKFAIGRDVAYNIYVREA